MRLGAQKHKVDATAAGAEDHSVIVHVGTAYKGDMGVYIDALGTVTPISTVTFDMSRDVDGAARDVEAAINAARSYLLANLPANPTYRKIDSARAPVLVLNLASKTVDTGALYDTASSIIQQKVSQISGVGQVTILGGSLPAVRIDLNP